VTNTTETWLTKMSCLSKAYNERLLQQEEDRKRFRPKGFVASIILNQRDYYSIGGCDARAGDSTPLKCCRRLDIITGEVTELAASILPIMDAAIYAVDNIIYLFGNSFLHCCSKQITCTFESSINRWSRFQRQPRIQCSMLRHQIQYLDSLTIVTNRIV
jgi:hypothetical protein